MRHLPCSHLSWFPKRVCPTTKWTPFSPVTAVIKNSKGRVRQSSYRGYLLVGCWSRECLALLHSQPVELADLVRRQRGLSSALLNLRVSFAKGLHAFYRLVRVSMPCAVPSLR